MTGIVVGLDEEAASLAAHVAPAIAAGRAELEEAERAWTVALAQAEAMCAQQPRPLRRHGLRMIEKRRRKFEAWKADRLRRITEAERACDLGFMPDIHAEAADLLADLFKE